MRTQNYARGDRFRAAFAGIDYAVLRDQRVRYKAVISAVFLITTLLFDDWFHFLLLLTVTALMVVAEIFNSTIAALCDYVQPHHDTLIIAVKDMAVSAAWVGVFIWATNIVVVIYELFRLMRSR